MALCAFPGEVSSAIESFGNIMDLDVELRQMTEQRVGSGDDGDGTLTMLELVCNRLFECSTELDLLKSVSHSAHKALFIGKNGNGKTTLINTLVHESFQDACRSSADSPADAHDGDGLHHALHSDDWACTIGSQRSHTLGTDEYQLIFGSQSASIALSDRTGVNVETLPGSRTGRPVSDAFRHVVDGTREPDECKRPFLPTAASSSTTAIPCSICFGEEYEVTIAYKSASAVAFVIKHFHNLIDEVQKWAQDPESTDGFTSQVRRLGHWQAAQPP
jgi:hypothetical protein